MQLARTCVALTVLIASLTEQVDQFTLAIDEPAGDRLELATAADYGVDVDVLVSRRRLTPSERQALATGTGMRSMRTTSPDAPGPAILSNLHLAGIPGDRRLRGEVGDVAIGVLGVGTSAEESIRQALEEPLPRAILVGVDLAVAPPNGWLRGSPLESTPVIWARGCGRTMPRSRRSRPSARIAAFGFSGRHRRAHRRRPHRSPRHRHRRRRAGTRRQLREKSNSGPFPSTSKASLAIRWVASIGRGPISW
jgi:hypothetical protein